jgi:hypothetical protein
MGNHRAKKKKKSRISFSLMKDIEPIALHPDRINIQLDPWARVCYKAICVSFSTVF